MNKARFTLIGESGTVYSWVETDKHWGETEFQERYGRMLVQRFNKDEIADSSSPIHGVLEALGQADEAPPFMWTEDIVEASIIWLGTYDDDQPQLTGNAVVFR